MKLSLLDKYHLENRAAFYSHFADIVKSDEVDAAVSELIQRQIKEKLVYDLPKWDRQERKNKSQKARKEQRDLWMSQVKDMNQLWLQKMTKKNQGFIEKMTLFWHGHFACRTNDNPYFTLEMNNLLRENALGNFRDLLFAVSRSAAMIAYLHLRQNKKGHPNEDFARELCELFTLGRDVDYTEKDVTEIARAFTGWSTDPEGRFVIREKQHDNGSKVIFGRSGNFSGEDVIEMILENRNCAKHISKKIYQFFVQEEINDDHVEELTDVFYNSGYDISVVMTHLFKAKWFYNSKGKMIKSPIEFLVGLSKMFELKFPDQKAVIGIQRYLGQVLFDPPNVAGWAGGRQWIDASRLALRLRMGSLVLNRGYVMDELNPALDEMLKKKVKKKDLRFYEEVDWTKFWKKNKGAEVFDLLIRTENSDLRAQYNNKEVKSIIRLLSTPDFQLT